MKLPASVMSAMWACAVAGCTQQSQPQIPVAAAAATVENQEPETAPKPALSARKVMSAPPTEYLNLHTRLIYPDWSKQAETASELKKSGDLFTVYLIEQLRKATPRVTLPDNLDEVIAAIQKSHGKKQLDGPQTLRLLEVCAYADITCHATEGYLKRWTIAHVREFMDIPEVRSELETIAKSYQSAYNESGSSCVDPQLSLTGREVANLLENRVRWYAKLLLKPPQPRNLKSQKVQ